MSKGAKKHRILLTTSKKAFLQITWKNTSKKVFMMKCSTIRTDEDSGKDFNTKDFNAKVQHRNRAKDNKPSQTV
jgi:hypothetical protein